MHNIYIVLSMQTHLFINYFIFAMMYIFSIYFSYIENTQSLGMLSLFVVNTSFLLYMSKDIFYHMTSKGVSTSIIQYLIIFSILGSLLINSGALLLENLSLMTLRTKNSDLGENNINMSTKNAILFNDFRTSQKIFFGVLSGVIASFLYYYENIGFNLIDIVNNGGNWLNLISALILGGGVYLLSLSSATFANSKEFSKVRITKQ